MPTIGWLQAAIGGVLGLLVGSFLNVVIHRLPRMLERQWAADCAAAHDASPAETPAAPPYNLARPRSHCPRCGHTIAWHENIPLLSYALLRGRCSACRAPIGLRYPLVELATGALFAWCLWRWGWSWSAAGWCLFAAALLVLALIDWDTTLLPDDLTLPLLWAGLIAAALGWTGTSLHDAVWGAVGGYLSLWLVYWAFKLATGKDGMGHGDFKLFAALGAWFGWLALPPLILLASTIGAAVGIAMKLRGALDEGGVVPFGPFLALAGVVGMVFGPQAILRAIGL